MKRTRTVTAWAVVDSTGKIVRFRMTYIRKEGKRSVEERMIVADWEGEYEQARLAVYKTEKKAIAGLSQLGCMLSRWSPPYRFVYLTGKTKVCKRNQNKRRIR